MNQDLAKLVEELVKKLGLTGVIYETLMQEVSKYYYLGVDNIEKMLNINIETINPRVLDYLKEYNFSLIQDMNTELADKLRGTISRNMISGNKQMMVKEIKAIFDTTQARAQMIARTESARAYSVGNYVTAVEAKKRGYEVKKYLEIVSDDRTSALCRRLGSKYTQDNAISIEKEFIDPAGEVRQLTSPFHPNCFDKNTLITTNKGKKKIKDIVVGDLVLTHKNRYKKVYHTMNRNSEDYYKINVGKGNKQREIEVTGEHPIMTNNGWKKVKDLTTQDWVMSL